jgi:hypothetical protein
MHGSKSILVAIILIISIQACSESTGESQAYVWQNVTTAASYPQSYNYPVFVMNGMMLALNNGAWISKDAQSWTKTALPDSGLNTAYQKFVQFEGAVHALGSMVGNYKDFAISPRILRTRDGKTWETLTEQSNLPARVFYGATVFRGKIWLVGGYDGKAYFNDHKEVWSSEDGINWTPEKIKSERNGGGTPIVFDDKLWFVGANRGDGNFSNAVTVSDDGQTWQAQSAPWSPRGGVAVWVFDNKLFMTGGKYSYTCANGEIKFVYSNDVW